MLLILLFNHGEITGQHLINMNIQQKHSKSQYTDIFEFESKILLFLTQTRHGTNADILNSDIFKQDLLIANLDANLSKFNTFTCS